MVILEVLVIVFPVGPVQLNCTAFNSTPLCVVALHPMSWVKPTMVVSIGPRAYVEMTGLGTICTINTI